MEPYTPSARNVFKNAFWLSFDHLGKTVLFNLLFIATSLPIITLPASFGALLHVSRLLVEQKQAGIQDFFAGFIKTGLRFTLFYACLILFFGIGLADVFFYIQTPSFISAILNCWVLMAVLFGVLLALYTPTLLIVHQNRGIVKLATALVLSNLFFSFRILFVGIIITVIGILSAAPLFLFMFTFLAFFLHGTYLEVTGRYTGIRPECAKERSVIKEFLIPARNQ